MDLNYTMLQFPEDNTKAASSENEQRERAETSQSIPALNIKYHTSLRKTESECSGDYLELVT